MNQINAETLRQAGYNSFPPGLKEYAYIAFQKTVCGVEHKLYFITFYLYDMTKVRAGVPGAELEGVAVESNFFLPGPKETAFEVSLAIRKDTTIAEVEAFYDNLYSKMGCVPDIHNN